MATITTSDPNAMVLSTGGKSQTRPLSTSDATACEGLVERRGTSFVLRLLSVGVEAAERAMCVAEASLSEVEVRCRRADAALAGLRTLAAAIDIDAPIHLPTTVANQPRNLTREEFSKEMRISVRRVDQHRKRMTEGIHYHRDGTRVIFHYPEAADFLRCTSPEALDSADDLDRLAMEEVSRRRGRLPGNAKGSAT